MMRGSGGRLGTACVLALSIVLLRVYTLFGTGAPVLIRLLPVVVFSAGLVTLLAPRPRLRINPPGGCALGAFLTLNAIAVARAVSNDTPMTVGAAIGVVLPLSAGVAFVAVALCSASSPDVARERVTALCVAPIVYVVFNVALFAVGIDPGVDTSTVSDSEGEATLLGFLGISAQRAHLPTASAVNSFGGIAGVALVIAGSLLLRRPRVVEAGGGPFPAFLVIGGTGAVAALLIADSRGALLVALAAILASRVIARAAGGGASAAALLVPASPAIIVAGLAIASDTALVGIFSRSGADFTTATGRTDVWAAIIDFLQSARWIDALGYGEYGQYVSNVSFSYAWAVGAASSPELATAHNLALQTVLDTGYLGLVAVVAVFATALRCLAQQVRERDDPLVAALFSSLLFLLFLGFVEANPAVYTADVFAAFVFLAIAACAAPTAPDPQPSHAASAAPTTPQHDLPPAGDR